MIITAIFDFNSCTNCPFFQDNSNVRQLCTKIDRRIDKRHLKTIPEYCPLSDGDVIRGLDVDVC